MINKVNTESWYFKNIMTQFLFDTIINKNDELEKKLMI